MPHSLFGLITGEDVRSPVRSRLRFRGQLSFHTQLQQLMSKVYVGPMLYSMRHVTDSPDASRALRRYRTRS